MIGMEKDCMGDLDSRQVKGKSLVSIQVDLVVIQIGLTSVLNKSLSLAKVARSL
jgi:hypothetical protein